MWYKPTETEAPNTFNSSLYERLRTKMVGKKWTR